MGKDLLNTLERMGYERVSPPRYLLELASSVSQCVEMKKRREIVDFVVVPSKEIERDDFSYSILVKKSVDAKVGNRKLERSTQIPLELSAMPLL